MTLKLRFLAVLLFCAAPALLFAQDITIVQVPGYLSLLSEQVPSLIKQAQPYFKRVGLNLRVQHVISDSSCLSSHYWAYLASEVECLRQEALAAGLLPKRRKTLVYFMLPPWTQVTAPVFAGGVQHTILGGAASKLCGRLAVGSASEIALPYNKPAFDHAVVIFAHETLHLFCAAHVLHKPNLMHPYALGYVRPGYVLPVASVTVRQVRRYLAKQRLTERRKK